MPSGVRQRVVDPQHSLGSQRLVESYVHGQNEPGQPAHYLSGRVALRRMHSLTSGQSFSSDAHGTSLASATTASCSSTAITTASSPACHAHPIYYHHTSSSYILQMDSTPDLPPPDVTSGIRCRTESFGYTASSFLAPSSLPCLGTDACFGVLPLGVLLPFPFGL